MQEIKQQIVLTLAPIMKANGYRKRNSTWHKQCQEAVLVFSTEKSRWGTNSFHFRLGIYLHTLGGELTPPYYRCPIQADLEQLVPDKFEFRRATDFDYPSSFTITERLAYISKSVSKYGLAWLEKYSTLSELFKLTQTDYERLYPPMLMWSQTYHFLRQISGGHDDNC